MDPISNIWFLQEFKIAGDNNVIHKWVATWLILFIMKKTAAAALTVRLSLKSRSLHARIKEGMLISYVQVINHLLKTYAMKDIIAKAGWEIFRFNQPPSMSPFQFADIQSKNTLHCPQVFDEYVLEGMLLLSLLYSIRHTLRWPLSSNEHAAFQKLYTKPHSSRSCRRPTAVWMNQTVIVLSQHW